MRIVAIAKHDAKLSDERIKGQQIGWYRADTPIRRAPAKGRVADTDPRIMADNNPRMMLMDKHE